MSKPAHAHAHTHAHTLPRPARAPKGGVAPPSVVSQVLSLPPKWLHMYDEFITRNAHQVSQIESALRSLTYIIPGRFRDAEIASESIHSGVQLLSLYHDTLLLRAASPAPSPHSRYTRHWTARSAAYRRVAYVLQMVRHTELLWEMAAKRRGERVRWRVVVVLELVKAACRLLILRITRRRPLVTPPLPERAPVPDNQQDEHEHEQDIPDDEHEVGGVRAPDREWPMPRTRLSLPPLPAAGDTTAFLLARVLTADDVKPAAQLLRARGGRAHAAEVLHALAPLAYALALAGARDRRGWAPWGSGLAVELAARGLREREGLRATALEREEWGRRGWALGRWAMRGPFYDGVTKGVVEGVKKRVPGLVAGILEDYAYLWENYYFSTSG